MIVTRVCDLENTHLATRSAARKRPGIPRRDITARSGGDRDRLKVKTQAEKEEQRPRDSLSSRGASSKAGGAEIRERGVRAVSDRAEVWAGRGERPEHGISRKGSLWCGAHGENGRGMQPQSSWCAYTRWAAVRGTDGTGHDEQRRAAARADGQTQRHSPRRRTGSVWRALASTRTRRAYTQGEEACRVRCPCTHREGVLPCPMSLHTRGKEAYRVLYPCTRPISRI